MAGFSLIDAEVAPAILPECCDYTAVILAGGLGTRLRPVVKGTPKVLARVCGRPFITFLLDRLAAVGVRQTVLLTGYGATEVCRTLGRHYAGMTLTYSTETSPLGTAGALRQALPRLDRDNLLLLNGDSFCAVDLLSLMTAHRRHEAEMTLTVTRVPDSNRFGEIKMAVDGRVINFCEKRASKGPGWINAGIYALAKTLVMEIPQDQACSLEKEWLPRWVNSRRLFGFKASGLFLDIGTPASYASAESFLRDQ